MAWLGGGPQVNVYGLGFFKWLNDQIFVVDEYPYARMGLRDDFYLPFPKEEEWLDSSMKETTNVFLNFYVLCFFCAFGL